jgi:ABC-type lipoprotein release transport system permease subunit
VRLTDLIRLSFGYALRRRWRVVPALVGVALGVTVLVIVLTASETIHRAGGDQILGQQSLRKITVAPLSSPGAPSNITDGLVSQLGGLNHVVAAYPIARIDVAAMTGGAGYVVPLGNLPAPPDYPPLVVGHWPGSADVVLPDSGLRDKNGALVPGRQLLGTTLTLQVRSLQGLGKQIDVPLTVTGIYHATAAQFGQATVYAQLGVVNHVLALSVAQGDDEYLKAATYPECVVDVDAAQNVTAVANSIESRHLITSYVDKEVSGLTGHLQGIQLTGAYLAVAIILLCTLSVGNMVASSVRQRRSELGIMLAIGFQHWMLGAVVAGEVFATGLAGAFIGIALALAGIAFFAVTHPAAGVVLPVASLPIVALLTALLCLLVGLLPAQRVMSMDCVDAIRAE